MGYNYATEEMKKLQDDFCRPDNIISLKKDDDKDSTTSTHGDNESRTSSKRLREDEDEDNGDKENETGHELIRSAKRGRCCICYRNIRRISGSVAAQKRTPRPHTFCDSCKKFYCPECFKSSH